MPRALKQAALAIGKVPGCEYAPPPPRSEQPTGPNARPGACALNADARGVKLGAVPNGAAAAKLEEPVEPSAESLACVASALRDRRGKLLE